MKKALSLMTAILLALSVCTAAVSAEKYGNGSKSDVSGTTDANNITDKAGNGNAQKDDKTAKDKDAVQTGSQNGSIDSLREQLKNNHKDKQKRLELVRQIADLRRQNNDSTIPVFVNGKEVKFDVPPVIKCNRTLIPVRAVTNALGATVEWDDNTQTATITKAVYGDDNTATEKIVVVMNLNTGVVTVNDKEVTLDVPPQLENNRTFVPLRFIAETFKQAVEWDEESESVTIEGEDEDEDSETSTQTTTGGTNTSQQQTSN